MPRIPETSAELDAFRARELAWITIHNRHFRAIRARCRLIHVKVRRINDYYSISPAMLFPSQEDPEFCTDNLADVSRLAYRALAAAGIK